MAQPHIQAALDEGHGEMTVADVFARIKRGFWKLWVIPGVGAGVTEFCEYPAYRALIIRLWAANTWAVDYRTAYFGVLEFAKACGCKAVEVFGRKGWERKLPGFKHSISVLRKEIWA